MAGRPVSGLPPLSEQRGISRQARAGAAAPASVAPAVRRVLSSDARPLDASARSFMESRFGRDFGDVRIHTGERAAASAEALNAEAYTAGSHVVFGAGAYRPETSAGRRLLAHELTHTIQQSRAGGLDQIQRTCRSHSDESFYASSPNYCRDTGFTGMFHSDKTCYREVPVRSSYFECPPGDQVCFSENGACEDSYDEASPVESRDADGSCNLHHACTWTYHTGEDVVPGLAEKAVAPVADWMGGLEREIYRLYTGG